MDTGRKEGGRWIDQIRPFSSSIHFPSTVAFPEAFSTAGDHPSTHPCIHSFYSETGEFPESILAKEVTPLQVEMSSFEEVSCSPVLQPSAASTLVSFPFPFYFEAQESSTIHHAHRGRKLLSSVAAHHPSVRAVFFPFLFVFVCHVFSFSQHCLIARLRT